MADPTKLLADLRWLLGQWREEAAILRIAHMPGAPGGDRGRARRDTWEAAVRGLEGVIERHAAKETGRG